MLLEDVPIKLSQHFKKRLLSDLEGYWETIHELRFYNILHSRLGYEHQKILNECPSVRRKTIDFAIDEGERIFFEVKAVKPEDYETAKEGGCIGTDELKLERCYKRAMEKFNKQSVNIVVVADGDTVKPPLFINAIFNIRDVPDTFFKRPEYNHISAVIILAGNCYESLFDYRVWFNELAIKQIPISVRKKLLNVATPHINF